MTRRSVMFIAAVALLAVGVGGWLALRLVDTDAPDAVSTDAALSQLEEATATSATPEDDDEPQPEPDVDDGGSVDALATWTVDDDIGEFGFDNASGSFAGFRVEKSFFAGGGATAVGRSGSVGGEIVIDEGTLSSASIEVDVTAMESDDSGRVGAIKDAVRADEFPTATFVVTEPVALDTDALTAGETVTVEVPGELTIAGVSRAATIPIEATIVDGGLGLIVGSVDLVWANHGVETPESRIATVADEGVLEFQLVVRR